MKHFFNLMATAAILCGLMFPQLKVFLPYVPAMILLLIFASFLDLKIEYRRLLRKELIVTFSLSSIIMPLITYYGLAAGFKSSYQIGLLLLACTPTGIMGMIFIQFLKQRDDNLALANFFFSNFSSVLMIPIILQSLVGRSVELQTSRILVQTFLLVFIPYIASRLARRFLTKHLLKRCQQGFKIISPLIVFAVVSASIGNASKDLVWEFSLLWLVVAVLTIYFLQGAAGLAAGKLFGDVGVKNTMTFISSSRNCHYALAIAAMNFSPLTSIPIIFGSIFHHITNAFWLWLLQKK